MKEYLVSIQEILEKQLIIKAESEEEACQKVKEMYDNDKVTLDYRDFLDKEIKVDGEMIDGEIDWFVNEEQD